MELSFPPQHLVVVLSLVGQMVFVRRIHDSYLERRCLIFAVLLGEVTGLGSDPPVIRTCHSFLELDDQ